MYSICRLPNIPSEAKEATRMPLKAIHCTEKRLPRQSCPCGRTSPRLGSIVGRVDTTARIKGMFVYPHQVEQVITRFEEIKRWQIEVTNPGGIDEMNLIVEASNFKREEDLLHKFREKIKLRPGLTVVAPGTLPPQIKPIEDKRKWD